MPQRRVDVQIAYWTLLLLASFLAAGLAGYGRHGELSPELEARIQRFFLRHLGGT